jgi:hypothetical protein
MGAGALKRLCVTRPGSSAARACRWSSQPFRYPHYQPIDAAFAVEGEPVLCEPIALSGLNVRPVEAELVYGGLCSREDLRRLAAQGVDPAGKIVISDNLRSFVAYPEVEAAGAAGFVSLTNLPKTPSAADARG